MLHERVLWGIINSEIMGHRLHVAKVYTVEYALPDNFNYEVTELHNLLKSLDVD